MTNLDAKLLNRLEQAARQRGISVTALLENWLDAEQSAPQAPATTAQKFFDISEAYLSIADVHHFQYVNPAFAAGLGRTPQELYNVNALDIVHPADQVSVAEMYIASQNGGSIRDLTVRFLHADGHYVAVTWFSTYDPVEKRHYGIGVPVAESAKELNIHLLDELSQIMARISDAFFALDANANFMYINQAAERIFRQTRSELLGHNIWEVFPAATEATFYQQYQKALQTGEHVSFTAYFAPVQAHFQVDAYPSETGLSVYFRDVTQQIEFAKQLERNNHRLGELVDARTRQLDAATTELRQTRTIQQILSRTMEAARDPVVLMDDTLRLLYVNQATRDIFGLDDSPDAGTAAEQFSPESLQRWTDVIKQAQGEDGVWYGELALQKTDGTPITLDVLMLIHEIEGKTYISGIGHDMSKDRALEQKLQELLKRERELHQLKTAFVTMVSHEFRTPMSTIMTSIDMIERYGDRVEPAKYYEKMRRNIHLMTRLLNDGIALLTFNEQDTALQPLLVNIPHLVQEALSQLGEAAANRKVDIQCNCEPVLLDRNLVLIILKHLLSNAIRYSGNSNEDVRLVVHHDDEKITLDVIDYGMGIPQETQTRIFEAFYRGEGVSHLPGIGLGMAFVKRAVERHKGDISIHSVEGIGTTVSVTLPQLKQGDVSQKRWLGLEES